MTPESTASAGPMTQAHGIVAAMPKSPRRYRARRLKDVLDLPEREIAEVLGCSQKTVNRDLAETVAPTGKTPDGAPVYPPGRFDGDPEYAARVVALGRDMHERNARLEASREFAGSSLRPGMRNQATDLSPERARIAAELSPRKRDGAAA